MNLDEASSTALQKNMILATTRAEIRSSHHLQIGYVLHIGYKARITSKKFTLTLEINRVPPLLSSSSAADPGYVSSLPILGTCLVDDPGNVPANVPT